MKTETTEAYSKALFHLWQEKKSEKTLEEIRVLLELAQKKQFRFLALSGTKAQRDFFQNLKLESPLREFLLILLENQNLIHLERILDSFLVLWEESQGMARVLVETANPLSPQQIQSITGLMEKRLNKKVILTLHENPELLGGWMIYHQDQEYRLSLSCFLENLREGTL